MHATPQNKTVFFLQFVCSSLEMHQPTFWLYQLLEKHCVDSIAGETLCGLYPYIYSYIYTVYIYIYVYVYVYVYANTPNTHPEAFSWQNICCHICLLEMQK